MLALFALLPLLASAAPLESRATSQYISSYRNGQCLTVSGTPADGAPVVTAPCGSASLWSISRGNGLVQLQGTNFCLDAGTSPHNNVASKIWTCYPGLSQQQWYYTDDDRIAITGGDQCLDEGPSGPQTYQCTTGNTNQIWYAYGSGTSTTVTTMTSTSMSTSTASKTSTMSTTSASPVPTTGVALHPNGDTSRCLTVAAGVTSIEGRPVEIAACFDSSDSNIAMQKWVLSRGSGAVQLAGTNYCLDAGVGPHNGVGAKIWECYPNLTQQTWYYTDDNRIAITGGDQCLDVTAGSGPTPGNPYSSLQSVQTWQCTSGNTQQVWTS